MVNTKKKKKKRKQEHFQIHVSAALSSVKELPLFLDEQLDGPQSRSGRSGVKL